MVYNEILDYCLKICISIAQTQYIKEIKGDVKNQP